MEGVRNQLKLVMLDWQSAKLRRCQDEEEKNKPDSMMLHIQPCWDKS